MGADAYSPPAPSGGGVEELSNSVFSAWRLGFRPLSNFLSNLEQLSFPLADQRLGKTARILPWMPALTQGKIL